MQTGSHLMHIDELFFRSSTGAWNCVKLTSFNFGNVLSEFEMGIPKLVIVLAFVIAEHIIFSNTLEVRVHVWEKQSTENQAEQILIWRDVRSFMSFTDLSHTCSTNFFYRQIHLLWSERHIIQWQFRATHSVCVYRHTGIRSCMRGYLPSSSPDH